MTQKTVALLLLLLGLCRAPVFGQENRGRLELGKPLDGELAGGHTHSFTLNLKVDQIARVVAEQRGIDLVLSVFAPDGSKLFEIDSPNGAAGDEPATVVAQQSGEYRLQVRSLDGNAAAGRYAIRLDRFLTRSEHLNERLAGLGRLWGAVKFFHPSLAYKALDWDGALVRTVPLVKAAHTPADYRAALQTLLNVLNDPATTIEVSEIQDGSKLPAPAAPREPTYFRLVDGVLVVFATDWAQARASGNTAAFLAKQPQMLAEVGKAKGVVIDCRYSGVSAATVPPILLSLYIESVLPALFSGVVPFGTERYRLHNGYAPQQGNTSGGYSSAFLTQTPGAIVGRAAEQKPLAVLIDKETPNLQRVWSGLQAMGAKIVHVGTADSAAGARLHRMHLPDGVRVSLRLSEFVHPNGSSVFGPDVELTADASEGEKAIHATIAALNTPDGGKAAAPVASAAPVLGQKDDPLPNMSFPTEEYRLLALFRFWNVINYFFPYKQLTDKPWNTVLNDFIPRFLANTSALDYEMTVAEMVARLQDSHGSVRFRNLDQHLGMFAPPLRLASAGGQLTVVQLVDGTAASAADVKLGDVILAIDGESVADRLAALARLTALSTPQSAYSYVYPFALRGAKDSNVKVRLQAVAGDVREIELTRTVPIASVAGGLPRSRPIYEVLPNGYGYIDLARLPLGNAQKAMDAVLNTPALIFDMRGYPNGTAWAIAPRLGKKSNVTAALFRRPLQSGIDFDDGDFAGGAPDYAFEQKLPPGSGRVYSGKVVMLINEFAISQSEHTCLFFESATDVTFIGSPTNGANGDVTNLVLPGGLVVPFTGHDVRHADGRQLQRVGIQPHLEVEPTAKGISEKRDEVLEAAVKYLDATVKR